MIEHPHFYTREISEEDGKAHIIRITYATKRTEFLPLSYGDPDVADAVAATLNLHRSAETHGSEKHRPKDRASLVTSGSIWICHVMENQKYRARVETLSSENVVRFVYLDPPDSEPRYLPLQPFLRAWYHESEEDS